MPAKKPAKTKTAKDLEVSKTKGGMNVKGGAAIKLGGAIKDMPTIKITQKWVR